MESQPLAMDLSCQSFAFEADFTADLRCIPMAVQRKRDLTGIKLKLAHWGELAEAERQQLLVWSDELRQQGDHWPQAVLATCRQLGRAPDPSGWSRLNELQRFALVKLSHPGHEHRNLPRALREFRLIGAI